MFQTSLLVCVSQCFKFFTKEKTKMTFFIFQNFVQINIPHRNKFLCRFFTVVFCCIPLLSVVFKMPLQLDGSLISFTEDNLTDTLWSVLNFPVSGACQSVNKVMKLEKQTDGVRSG